MRIFWSKDIIRFRARIIKNMLAMISFSVMFSACGNGASDNENVVNEDSLKQVREQQQLDSIAYADSVSRADSLAKVREDSITKAYDDSLKNAQNYLIPVNTVIPDVKPKYGPPPGYFPEDKPQTRYGVVYN